MAYNSVQTGCTHPMHGSPEIYFCPVCGMESPESAFSAGFVETTDKVFPITIIAYRGKNKVTVSGIREDSVMAKRDRDGNCNLSFEFKNHPDRIGYIPCVDWYETECD